MTTSDWRVKYDGTCSRCGTILLKGTVAVWERATRTMHCVECPAPESDIAEAPPVDTGVAGASARRTYERRRQAREARVKGRVGDRVGGLFLALTGEPQATRAWETGARGEEKLAKALADLHGVRVLNDRRVAGTKGNIDHVVIAPAGVFVVDAKHYAGQIHIRNRGWFFRPDYRLYVGRRDCSHLAEGLGWQVQAVQAALRSASVDPMPAVTPVLCFVDGDWPIISPPDSFAGVRLESERSIKKLITVTLDLDEAAVERLFRVLAKALPPKQM